MVSGSAVVVGAGLMGSEIATDIIAEGSVSELTLIDSSDDRLRRVRNQIKLRYRNASFKDKLSLQKLDVAKNKGQLKRLLEGAAVGIGALPHGIAEGAVDAAVKAGTNYVDLIFSWRLVNFSSLDRRAKEAGITLVPACGLAPGLTNILVQRSAELIEVADEVKIMVGGIPEQPIPPFNYKIVFSLESVLEEYTRDAVVVRNGTRKVVPAMSELEEVEFDQLPGIKFEAFITDGLSTLPFTVKARSMVEKTVRWPGHAVLISLLKSIGLLSTKTVPVQDSETRVAPRDLLVSLLSEKLKMGQSDRDMTLLKVVVNNSSKKVEFSMVDRYDRRNHVTSMARTTAYPCSTVALMLLEKKIRATGFKPPETVVRGPAYEFFMRRLAARNIAPVQKFVTN